jgi:uncharacterized protein YaaW (UPF0174 family)
MFGRTPTEALRERVSSMAPNISEIESSMFGWSIEELTAFFCCVRASESVSIPETRDALVRGSLNELFWAYSSKSTAQAKQSADKLKETIYDYLPGRIKTNVPKPTPAKELHEYGSALSYEYLVREVCKKLDIQGASVEPTPMLEVYLVEDLFVKAAAQMNAQQRHAFLTIQVQLDDFATVFPQTRVSGPATTLAALAVAQGSGFGVYVGATTALGLLSHAVGVTLPFAIYTGMTSTIAFLIGPFGFLGAGAWLGFRILGPEWPRILRGVLHLIAMRAKYAHAPKPLSLASTGV